MAVKTVKNYLRPREVAECKADLRACDAQEAQLKYDTRASRGAIREAKRSIEKRLEQAPPDLTPDQKDKVNKRVLAIEEKLKEGMLSHEEMRRNPPGATERNISWMNTNKDNIRNWKNGILALMKGAPDSDVRKAIDIRRLRPHASRMSMDNAQIPVETIYSFPSEAYKNGYDLINWHREEKPEPSIVDEDFDSEE